MDIILVLIKASYIFLGIIYLKSSFTKIKKPYLYYMAIKNYNLIRSETLLIIITPLLIVLELSLALLLISTVFQKSALIIGILFQSFILYLILTNMNKEYKNNCNCFPLNTPKKITTKELIINIILLFLIIVVYGIERRFL